jgi:hypothetical protein
VTTAAMSDRCGMVRINLEIIYLIGFFTPQKKEIANLATLLRGDE